MNAIGISNRSSSSRLPNGSGAAALLSAGIGAFALSIIAIAADRMPGFGRHMAFYKPTGPLSGVTTLAIVIWLVAWAVLEVRWRKRDLRLRPVSAAAIALLLLSLLLTFPPIADLL